MSFVARGVSRSGLAFVRYYILKGWEITKHTHKAHTAHTHTQITKHE